MTVSVITICTQMKAINSGKALNIPHLIWLMETALYEFYTSIKIQMYPQKIVSSQLVWFGSDHKNNDDSSFGSIVKLD